MRRICFAVIVTVISCTKPDRAELILSEAALIHHAAVELGEQLETRLDSLEQLDATSVDSLKSIHQSLKIWEGDLIEVPGHESHEHSAHEHHVHEKSPDLTPEQMLEVQQLLLERVQKIEMRLINLGKR
jgi:hypothetical protein